MVKNMKRMKRIVAVSLITVAMVGAVNPAKANGIGGLCWQLFQAIRTEVREHPLAAANQIIGIFRGAHGLMNELLEPAPQGGNVGNNGVGVGTQATVRMENAATQTVVHTEDVGTQTDW
jgi:hypothetical protein